MTIHHRKESPATLECLRFEVRFGNSIPTSTPLGKLLLATTYDDGLSPLLSAVVCLVGSWMDSDKGAT